MTTSNFLVYYLDSLTTQLKTRYRWDKIVVRTLITYKKGDLEEEERAGSPRRTRKELTGVVQGVSGKKRLLERFQNGCKAIFPQINSPS